MNASMARSTRLLPRALSPRLVRLQAQQLKQWQKRGIVTAARSVEHVEPEPYIPEEPPVHTSGSSRKETIRQAKPFSEFLTDSFDRQHDYLRISLTERCNLRCLYCMPEEGIQLSPNRELLTTAEIHYLSALFVNQGVTKIRLTGGEPTVRKDIVPLMHQIGSLRRNGLKELALTTNGISLHRKLDEMAAAGLTGVNISLDTLDPFQFQLLTRRQGFNAVMKSIDRVKEMNKLGAGIKLKINAVVMRGLNDHQILPFVDMTQDDDIEVRFIEYMPFGGNKWSEKKMMSYSDMLDVIREKYPDIARLKGAKNDTSKTWQVPGFVGRVGFITSMTHNFCGTCNRLRITSDGNLKVCLHGEAEVSLRDLLRKDHGGEPMDEEAFDAIRQLELDRGREPSLCFDGQESWMSKEQQLLEVIGAAVKRKKEKHAGMGEHLKTYSHNVTSRPRSMPVIRPTQPWSSIPTHLLPHSAPTLIQSRAYSSDNQPDSNSGFGFQSLSSLFSQPETRKRYSRPRERDPQQEKDNAEDRIDLDRYRPSRSQPEKASSQEPADQSFFTAAEQAQPESPGREAEPRRRRLIHKYGPQPSIRKYDVQDTHTKDPFSRDHSYMRPAKQRAQRAHQMNASLARHERVPISEEERSRKIQAADFYQRRQEKTERARLAASQRDGVKAERVPHPFEADAPRQSDEPAKAAEKVAFQPWGLREEDRETIESFIAPAKSDREGSTQGDTATDGSFSSRVPPAIQRVASPKKPGASHDEVAIPQSQPNKLTHLKPTGEAHMVDVGEKPATKRIAIAFGHVLFKNDVPLEQIKENTNKKGDVLGIARVAGIMAAKRTSDIIPLCHPIAISKVEVDVVPMTRDAMKPTGMSPQSGGGGVLIQARVECIGPTGVEMEALTAVNAAAMTVVDMCKAVDKDMTIGSRIVFKTGGRSGMVVNSRWSKGFLRYFRAQTADLDDMIHRHMGWAKKESRTGEGVN